MLVSLTIRNRSATMPRNTRSPDEDVRTPGGELRCSSPQAPGVLIWSVGPAVSTATPSRSMDSESAYRRWLRSSAAGIGVALNFVLAADAATKSQRIG